MAAGCGAPLTLLTGGWWNDFQGCVEVRMSVGDVALNDLDMFKTFYSVGDPTSVDVHGLYLGPEPALPSLLVMDGVLLRARRCGRWS